jgi:CheY-like chemotaxis protein
MSSSGACGTSCRTVRLRDWRGGYSRTPAREPLVWANDSLRLLAAGQASERLLIDCSLPGQPGYEAAQKITSREPPCIPLVNVLESAQAARSCA